MPALEWGAALRSAPALGAGADLPSCGKTLS